MIRQNFINGVFLTNSRGFIIKYFTYADDVILTLSRASFTSLAFKLYTVCREFSKSDRFKTESQKMNPAKGGPPVCCDSNVKWKSDFTEVLNLPFDSIREISGIFFRKIYLVKTKVFRLNRSENYVWWKVDDHQNENYANFVIYCACLLFFKFND